MTSLEEAYELIAFLASSANGLLMEPRLYGPLRCLDAISRLIEFLEKTRCVELDDFLKALKEEVDKGKLLVLVDEEKFKKFIIDLNMKLADRVKEVEAKA